MSDDTCIMCSLQVHPWLFWYICHLILSWFMTCANAWKCLNFSPEYNMWGILHLLSKWYLWWRLDYVSMKSWTPTEFYIVLKFHLVLLLLLVTLFYKLFISLNSLANLLHMHVPCWLLCQIVNALLIGCWLFSLLSGLCKFRVRGKWDCTCKYFILAVCVLSSTKRCSVSCQILHNPQFCFKCLQQIIVTCSPLL